MTLPDKLYKVLKYILMYVVSPAIALITGLGNLYGWDTTMVVGTITLVATFVAAVTGVSQINYNKGSDTK